jgi:hypothetical protein
VTPENSYREYRAGSRAVVDGLFDYWPLHPPLQGGPLHVVAGDWDCGSCGLNYQWARVVLEPDVLPEAPDVSRGEPTGPLPAVIAAVETFVAETEEAFSGIHYLCEDLALLAGNWDRDGFQRLPVDKRIRDIVRGYRDWYQQVALQTPQ